MNQDLLSVEQKTPSELQPLQSPNILQPQNHNNWFNWGLILVVLLFFGVGAGYYASSNKKPAALQYPKSIKQMFTTFKFSDKTQSADTSNWKIYTNQYYQLKYPEEFYKPHVPEKFYGNSISSVSFLSINDTNQENSYQDVFPFNISVLKNKNNLSLDEKSLFKQNPDLSYDISFLKGKQSREITLGNIKAYQYDDIAAGVSGYEREIRTIKGNNIYVITVEYSYGKPVEKYRELVDQILSTFKFTQ